MVAKNPGPLAGIRVANLSQIWAGPHAMQQFADMGAEVVRIESIQVGRGTPLKAQAPSRGFANRDPGPDPWNRWLYFNDGQVGMLGVTMDLSRPQGKELLRKLVLVSDFLVENFAHGVMEKLGLGYEVVRSWKPDIIYLSAPGYGAYGPEASYVAYGTNQLHMTGLANLTGYPGEGPMQTAVNYGDPTAGIHLGGVILAALLYRNRTGKGCHIDVSQRETGVMCIGERFLDNVMNGRKGEPIGNTHPYKAPHGCYPCQGDDVWVTISVGSDEEWDAFCRAIGNRDWTREPKFGDALSRWRNRDEMDAHIAEWTRERDHYAVMHLLQQAGVAAGAVLKNYEVFDDPQHVAREFYQPARHTKVGTFRHPMIGWRMSRTPGWIRRAAPCMGEHNEYIYGEVLGLTEDEIAELARDEIIGTAPIDPALRDPSRVYISPESP